MLALPEEIYGSRSKNRFTETCDGTPPKAWSLRREREDLAPRAATSFCSRRFNTTHLDFANLRIAQNTLAYTLFPTPKRRGSEHPLCVDLMNCF